MQTRELTPDNKTYTGSPLIVMTKRMRMVAAKVDDGDLRAWDKLRPFLESNASMSLAVAKGEK